MGADGRPKEGPSLRVAPNHASMRHDAPCIVVKEKHISAPLAHIEDLHRDTSLTKCRPNTRFPSGQTFRPLQALQALSRLLSLHTAWLQTSPTLSLALFSTTLSRQARQARHRHTVISHRLLLLLPSPISSTLPSTLLILLVTLLLTTTFIPLPSLLVVNHTLLATLSRSSSLIHLNTSKLYLHVNRSRTPNGLPS